MARTDPRPHYGTKRRIGIGGYVDIYEPAHPLARADGYVSEHRRLAWEAGLFSDPEQQIHHVNGDKQDNRLENFAVLSAAEHALLHAEDRGYVQNQFGRFAVKPRELRQSAPKLERPCVGCGAPIQTMKRRDARYCSVNCRSKHWKRRARGVA